MLMHGIKLLLLLVKVKQYLIALYESLQAEGFFESIIFLSANSATI